MAEVRGMTLLIICIFFFKSYALSEEHKATSGKNYPMVRINYGDMGAGAAYFADDLILYFCEGKTRTLTATGGSGSYIWYYNDVIIPGATTNQLTIDKPGRYYVTTNGTKSNTVTMVISPKLKKPRLTFKE